jgi:biotin operon repressor
MDAIEKTIAALRDWGGTMRTAHHPGFSLFLEVKKACDDKG